LPREREQREQGAREQGAREQGAREQGAREQGAREQGAREQGAREQGAREQNVAIAHQEQLVRGATERTAQLPARLELLPALRGACGSLDARLLANAAAARARARTRDDADLPRAATSRQRGEASRQPSRTSRGRSVKGWSWLMVVVDGGG
jgi:hypothetical protein